MKNLYTKLGLGVGSVVSFLGVASLALADYSTSSFNMSVAQADIQQLSTDVGIVVGLVIGLVLVIAVGLLGLGYAYRQFKKKVTGRKF